MATIGKRNLLSIVRASQPGLYLDGGELGEILLPGRYTPAGLPLKQKLDVFVYGDSEKRLVATTEKPHAIVGEFAYMKVINIHPQIARRNPAEFQREQEGVQAGARQTLQDAPHHLHQAGN